MSESFRSNRLRSLDGANAAKSGQKMAESGFIFDNPVPDLGQDVNSFGVRGSKWPEQNHDSLCC